MSWNIGLPSREEMLLGQIEEQLRVWQEKGELRCAADMLTQISTQRLATIMAWAQIGLRDYVLSQKRAIEQEAVNIKPMFIPFDGELSNER